MLKGRNKSGCVQSPAPTVSETKVIIKLKMGEINGFFEGSTDGEKTYQIQGLCAFLYFE